MTKGSAVDLNLVVIAGRIAAEPEIRTFESGATLMRFLVTVRSEEPRSRLDVIPVAQWDPDPDDIPDGSVRGRSIWVAGAVQRRFWSVGDGRKSRIEIIAHDVSIRDEESSFTDGEATAS
jgi:single-stranded DNA-binding protein